jgi:hypothetical protein
VPSPGCPAARLVDTERCELPEWLGLEKRALDEPVAGVGTAARPRLDDKPCASGVGGDGGEPGIQRQGCEPRTVGTEHGDAIVRVLAEHHVAGEPRREKGPRHCHVPKDVGLETAGTCHLPATGNGVATDHHGHTEKPVVEAL